MSEYDVNETISSIREFARLAGINAGRANPKMDGSDRVLNAGSDLVRLAIRLARDVGHLTARPKLWVVRGRGGLLLLGEVDIGDCGDALPCIAAFDREVDADYVAACVEGTVEEWGGK